MHNLTLRTKFAVVISAVFIVATLLLLVTLSGVTTRIINDFARRIATKQALNDKNKILAVIEREVVLAQKMADDTVLKRWFLSADNPAMRSAAMEQLESYRRLFRDKSYFAAMGSTLRYYVANKSEKSTMVVLSPEKPADKWYFESIRKVDKYALNLDYGTAINQIKVWINVIMKDGGGNNIGIVGSGIDITDFLNKIIHTEEKGISAVLVDRQGVVQAYEDHVIVERNATERDESKKITIYSLVGDQTFAEQLKLALRDLPNKNESIAVFPLQIAGKKSVAAVAFIKDIGWYNIVLLDVSNVLKINDFMPIILASIIILLIVILVIGWQMHKMVLAPLNLLNVASEKIAQGSYATRLPVRRNDEIGILTKSFNIMAETVQNHTEYLEENVRVRTTELIDANVLLEKSQQRITESIEYASVIQASILPDEQLFKRYFKEWFKLYLPCDVVGGDLYWLREHRGRILLAVIDCTGHGVPGAFMTMTVNSLLNQIVDTAAVESPGQILSELNRLLQSTLRLRQEGGTSVDAGLDIALCCIDPDSRILTYSAAGISLYAMINGKLHEIKGDRQRLGYQSSDLDFTYTAHVMEIKEGCNYYAASDGFFDEGGGEKNYCFGNDRFDEMLKEHSGLPLSKQGEEFAGIIKTWRGNNKQRDDITMVGFSL